jgi:hypothetical protein
MQRLSCFLLCGTVGVSGLIGCADGGDEGILVVKNVEPGAGCTFTGELTESFFSSGEVSIQSTSGYLFAPQLESRIVAPMGDDGLDRTVITSGVNVNITFADSSVESMLNLDSNLTHFNQPMAVMLDPVMAGVAVVSDGQFTLIPQGIIDALNKAMPGLGAAGAAPFSTLLLADFQVLGTMSGENVTSQSFSYGVTVGNDVVVQEVGDCPAPAGTTILVGNACNVFQDGIVTCCRDTTNPDPNSNLICPAPLGT